MDLFADFEARARRIAVVLQDGQAVPAGVDPSCITARPPGPRATRGTDVVVHVAAPHTDADAGAPHAIIAELAQRLAQDPDVSTVSLAAGFLNLRLAPRYVALCLATALSQGVAYGRGRAAAPVVLTTHHSAARSARDGIDRVRIVADAVAGLLEAAGRSVAFGSEDETSPLGQGGASRIVIRAAPGTGEASPRVDRSLVVRPCRVVGAASCFAAAATTRPTAGPEIDDAADAALRFAVLSHRTDLALTLDHSVVTDRSHAAPLFHVQYAHARLCAVLRTARGRFDGAGSTDAITSAEFTRLDDPGERRLIAAVLRFPHVVALAADRAEPHRLALLLRDLADAVHLQWNRSKDQPQLRFVNEEQRDLTQARLGLMTACALVLTSGLGIFGIKAPDEMR